MEIIDFIPSVEQVNDLIEKCKKNLKKGWQSEFLSTNYPNLYDGHKSRVYITFRNFMTGTSMKNAYLPPFQFYFKLNKFYTEKNQIK